MVILGFSRYCNCSNRHDSIKSCGLLSSLVLFYICMPEGCVVAFSMHAGLILTYSDATSYASYQVWKKIGSIFWRFRLKSIRSRKRIEVRMSEWINDKKLRSIALINSCLASLYPFGIAFLARIDKNRMTGNTLHLPRLANVSACICCIVEIWMQLRRIRCAIKISSLIRLAKASKRMVYHCSPSLFAGNLSRLGLCFNGIWETGEIISRFAVLLWLLDWSTRLTVFDH